MGLRLLLILLLLSPIVYGQYFSTEKKLIGEIAAATTKAEQVEAMERLAEFYYIYKAGEKGDSVLQAALTIAEMANDKNLILHVFFGEALNQVSSWSSKQTFERALSFAEKGIRHARETGNNDIEAFAYLRKASLLRKRGAWDDALKDANLALTSMVDSENDSLLIAINLETGQNHLAKAEYLSAYKNFNNAYDLAYRIGDVKLQSEAFHCFADLYWAFDDKDLAKLNLLKSVDLNTRSKNIEGLLNDYVDLYRLLEKPEYLVEVDRLAKLTKSEFQKYFNKRLVFSSLMVVKKDYRAGLKFLEDNEGLKQALLNPGMGNYYFNIGHLYYYAGKADSAMYYYKLAEPDLTTSYDGGVAASFYYQFGRGLALSKDYKAAATYYLKALDYFKTDIKTSKYLTDSLRKLYVAMGDYNQAYQHTLQFNFLNDSLRKLEKQRDFVYLEFEREKKMYEKDMADVKSAEIRTRNLQYMGISLATVLFFIVLIFIGMFPTSRWSMKMLSFFAFICLFEFIILLIDTWLHNLAHGEPLKIWLAKVGIIAILLPLHHYLDHLSFKFLSSHKLEKLRQQFSVKRIISKIKVVAPEDVAKNTGTKQNTGAPV